MSERAGFSLVKALGDAGAFVPRGIVAAGLPILLMTLSGLVYQKAHLAGTSNGIVLVFALAATVLFKIMALGALYRVAYFGASARAEGLGVLGIQVGGAERRLLVGSLAVGLFLLMVGAGLFFVFSVAFLSAGFDEGGGTTTAVIERLMKPEAPGGSFVLISVGGILLIMAILVVKLGLYQVATVAERKTVSLNALSYATGQTGRLFAGYAIILLPFVLLWGALAQWLGSRGAMDGIVFHAAGPFTGDLWLHVAAEAATFLLVLPLVTGFLTSAYRQIIALRAK